MEAKIATTEFNKKELETAITLVHNLGIPSSLSGYRYVLSALKIIVKDNLDDLRVTKVLYPLIAKENNTTPSRVERAIRHTVEMAIFRGNPDLMNKLFGYSYNSEKR